MCIRDRELGGKTLQLIMAPNLHWPDTMYTLAQEDGILFTCDSFGAHYALSLIHISLYAESAGQG